MLPRWLSRSRTAPACSTDGSSVACATEPGAERLECPTTCPLPQCARGNCAVVVRVECDATDACRLRALGVYEGARVDVVDSRNGLLLQVRGSRIALGSAVAATIAVIPVP